MDRLTEAQVDLVAAHIGFATRAAVSAQRRWPGADPADLLSWAFEGLMDAARRFDPESGAKFTTYAWLRIRGQIVDGFRAETHRGKRLREFPYDYTAVDAKLEDRADRDIVRAACSVDLGFEAVEDHVYAAATIETLHLTERERYVIVELGSGTTMAEIGDALGVTESRVSQIRKAIYDRLPVNARAPKRCAWCAKALIAPVGRQDYCDPTCRRRASKARERMSA